MAELSDRRSGPAGPFASLLAASAALRWETTSRVARAAFLIALLLLPLATAAGVYARFLGHWFITDDFLWLEAAANPDLPESLRGAFEFPRGPTPYWRPLIDGYFFGMYRVFQLEATAYHVVNLLVHGANAALLLLIVRRISRSWLAGAMAALLFVATPAYGTTVVWASAATELLASFFGLASAALFLAYQDRPRARLLLALSVGCFFAALLAKETSIAIPALVALFSLAARPAKDGRDLRRLALNWAPFVLLAGAYLALQYAQVYSSSTTTNYEVDGDAIPRLLDRLRWLAVPLPPTRADWIEPAQWSTIAGAAIVCVASASRRLWAPPALFAATLVALVPISFLTSTFAPRWVYLASLPWAGFLATAALPALRWVFDRQPVVAAAALGGALVVLGFVFVPETVDVQRWVPGQARQMREIREVLSADCSTLGPGDRVIVFPLPIVDPGYAVSSLVQLLYPESSPVRARPSMDPPNPRDCLLEFRGGAYRAAPGSQIDANRYWVFAPATSCPEAVPWQDAGVHVGSMATLEAPLIGVRAALNREHTVLELGAKDKLLAVLQGPEAGEARAIYREVRPGTVLCVTGTVRVALGAVLVDVTSPQDIALKAEARTET